MDGFEAIRARYMELQNNLWQLQGVDEALNVAKTKQKAALDALNAQKAELASRESACRKSAKNLEKVQGARVKKMLRSKKHDEEVEKCEAAVQRDKDKVQVQREGMKPYEEELSRADETLRVVQADHRRKDAMDEERKRLLAQGFEGRAGDLLENQWEWERNNVRSQHQKAAEEAAKQQRAFDHLQKSREDMKKVIGTLKQAQGANTIDMLTGNRGGPGLGGGGLASGMAGMKTNQNMRQAKGMTEMVQKEFEKAVEINPSIPQATIAVKGLRSFMAVTNVIFDGLLTDVMVRSKIRGALQSADTVMSEINAACSFQQDVRTRAITEAEMLNQRLQQAEKNLERERSRLMYVPVGAV